MRVVVDSREHWTQGGKDQHISSYFNKHGIEWEVKKLDCGDYMIPDGKISIDRKQNLQELATNFLNRADRARFMNEIRRARQNGIKLIILCEHGGKIKSYEDVRNWQSKYSKVTGKALADAIFRLYVGYGVPVLFCDKRNTAKKIIEILNNGGAYDDTGTA